MRLRRAIVALVVVLAGLIAIPGRALAHAELLSSDPSSGAVLDVAPSAVTLTFNEPVEISLGGIRLFNGRGEEVTIGASHHPSGHTEQVAADVGALVRGSYVVDYQIISADSHPVQGAFTFQVGQVADLQPGVITDIINSSHTNRTAAVGLGIARGIIIGAMALVFGGLIVIGLGIVAPSRRVRWLIGGAAATGALAGLLQLPLEVGYATNKGLASLFDTSAWSAAFDARIGLAWVARAAIIAAFGTALLILIDLRGRRWWLPLATVGLIGVGIVSSYGGHGATGRWIPVGVLLTALHVAAMCVWLGGVVLLLLERRQLEADGVRRFSGLALTMIAVVVASGVVQSIRQLGTWSALTGTSYGTLLIWKTALVAVLIAVAALSRRIVRRAREGRAMDLPRLGRAIAVEALLALSIVTVTSLLMAANPSQVVASRPFSVTLTDGNYLASITLEPGRPGQNEMHIYLNDAASSLSQPDEVHVEISDPARDVATLDIPVTRSGAGHFTTSTATFPYSATWTLTVTARYNTFDNVQFTTPVKIG